MPWQDRLRVVKYTSPSGLEFTWNYEGLSRSFDKQGGEFTFPDAQGTFIQDLKSTGRRYPFICFFNGDDNDTESDSFFEALSEVGVGILDHPRYGRKNVVPFGSINQRDDLKNQANQSVVEVTFFDTIDIIFPSGLISPSSSVLDSINGFNDVVSSAFAGEIDADTAIEAVSFRDRMSLATSRISEFLEPVYSQTDSVRLEAEAVISSINNSIETLVGEPLAYATQTIQLMQLPARAGDSIKARLDGYLNLANQILGNESTIQTAGNDSQPENNFRVDELSLISAFSGYGISAINGDFQTKLEAIEAADNLFLTLDEVTNWRDLNNQSLSIVDTPAFYQETLSVVSNIAGYLVAVSFDLPQQKTIILDRARTVIDLAAELFPDLNEIDSKTDELIQINEIVGEQIFELPEGKAITYFL